MSPRTVRPLAALLVLGLACAIGVGCELVAEFDRTKIPTVQDDAAADVTTRDAPTADVRGDSPLSQDAGSDATDATASDANDATASDANDATASDASDAATSDASDATSDASDAASDASDAGDGSDGSVTLNGCGPVEFAANDVRDAGTPVINFPDDAGNLFYQPACQRISVNQSVTFNGPFATHPLHQYPSNQTGSPLPLSGSPETSGTTQTYQFTQQGTFGYGCANHEGMNMFGAINVVP